MTDLQGKSEGSWPLQAPPPFQKQLSLSCLNLDSKPQICSDGNSNPGLLQLRKSVCNSWFYYLCVTLGDQSNSILAWTLIGNTTKKKL